MAPERSRSREIAQRLLAGIEPAARQTILSASRRQTFRPAHVLFREGEPAERLLMLHKGRVKISRLTRTGREVVMEIVAPGDIFGLGSLMEKRAEYFCTAEALTTGDASVWTRGVIRRLAREYPRLSANALQMVLAYVAQFAERHEEMVSGLAEHRLARALSRLATRIGHSHSSHIEVHVKNEQLASLANVSVFTVSRVLKRWERKCVIAKRRGVVRIVLPARLLID